MYIKGKFKYTDENLFTPAEIAYQLDHNKGGKNHVWNMNTIDIGNGKKYQG